MTRMHHNQSSHHRGLPNGFRYTLTGLGISLLLMLCVAPAPAQAQAPGEPGYWKQHFPAQVNTLLRAEQPALREQGMQLIVKFQHDEAIIQSLSGVRSQLYSIFFDRRNADEQRILALSALYATDRGQTAQMMADWVEEESSPRVRRHVQLALHQRG